MLEEYLEQIIALGMASLATLLITKVVSTVFVITLTQTVKVALKTLFLKIIQQIMKGVKAQIIMNKFLEFLNSNKWTLIIGIFIAAVAGYCGFLVCDINTVMPLWLDILIAVAVGIVVLGLVFFIGSDNAWALTLRVANKVLSKDKYEQLCNLYKDLESLQVSENTEAELQKQAEKEQAQKLAKAQKLIAKQEAEELAKQKKAQEEAEILALAEKLKAEQSISADKVENTTSVNPTNTNNVQ